jgi:PRTRC genetic system ThiF family protein
MSHYTESYLLAPTHPVTVSLIGCGGTGSHVLSALARLNEGLIGLGHPGIHLTAFDDDIVTPFNIGRQMFSPSDLGNNKAVALITRINRFFGLNWDASPIKVISSTEPPKQKPYSNELIYSHLNVGVGNIVISCVDSVAPRLALADALPKIQRQALTHEKPFYFMDFGNSQDTGQYIIGTVGKVNQPNGGVEVLPDVTSLYKDTDLSLEDDAPSCSMAESLQKQDLFINSLLALHGVNLLWKMFREAKISFHGGYLNLTTGKHNPIPIN